MPDDTTVDFVVAFVAISLLALGLSSWLIGWAVRVWDRIVNHYPAATTTDDAKTGRAERTDQTGARPSAPIAQLPRLQVDRTRTALIEELLTLGWTATDFRREKILRGENADISAELDAARKRLGLIPPAAYVTPIAGRPTAAQFQDDPDIPAYEAPPR